MLIKKAKEQFCREKKEGFIGKIANRMVKIINSLFLKEKNSNNEKMFNKEEFEKVFNKIEIDSFFSKEEFDRVFNKIEIDNFFSKEEFDRIFNKIEIDNFFSKEEFDRIFNKIEIDSFFSKEKFDKLFPENSNANTRTLIKKFKLMQPSKKKFKTPKKYR